MPRLKDIIKQTKELEHYEYLVKVLYYQHIIHLIHTLLLSLENSNDLNLQKPLALSFTCFFFPNIFARFASVFFLPALPGLYCICQVLKNSKKIARNSPSAFPQTAISSFFCCWLSSMKTWPVTPPLLENHRLSWNQCLLST